MTCFGRDVRSWAAIAGLGALAIATAAGCGEDHVRTLSLVAGALGGPGFADGVGAAARLSGPRAVASDGAGNLFVADSNNNTIRKVVIATGEVTTLAGSPGPTGSTDGTGADARFYLPLGMATDGLGNLFVADAGNCTIRKVVIATGEVSTLAGSPGASGMADGTGANARFSIPGGVVSDGGGNLFVADSVNNAIRKVVLATGEVSTLGGPPNGTGPVVSFSFPMDLASDRAGNLFVVEGGSNTLKKLVIATGEVTALAGGAGTTGSVDGVGAGASFGSLMGVTSDGAGSLFVSDANAIRKVVIATGEVTTLAGSSGTAGSADGAGADARFSAPLGLASDGAGDLFVADSANNTVREAVITTGEVSTFAGASGSRSFVDGRGGDARFAAPSGLASDGAESLFVADGTMIRKVVVATGEVTTLAGSPLAGSADGTGAAAGFNGPSSVAWDGAGNLFVADTGGCTIRKVVVATGEVSTLAGAPCSPSGISDGTGTAAGFGYPSGLAIDGAETLFVGDSYTIRKVVIATGVVTTIAGSPGAFGHVDGYGSAAEFGGALGLASDGQGNLFVADPENSTIREVVIATGLVTTLAGSWSASGSADGTGADARFGGPVALTIDGAGNLLVADPGNHAVRKIAIASGLVTTLVGSPQRGALAPGPLPAALNSPTGVAMGPLGSLFITDEGAVLAVR
jgi:sugar lactone lactonase YvrE